MYIYIICIHIIYINIIYIFKKKKLGHIMTINLFPSCYQKN